MDTDAWLTDPSQKRSPREREADEQAIRLAEASFEELRALGLSVTQAKRVLRHRDRGELRRVADLAGVPGLPQSLHEELERKLRD
jgi:DNA uptake protein ComE-like DNA-binding protein